MQRVAFPSTVGLVAMLAVASPAWAASPQDQAAAEVLFQQGKALADAGDWQNACPKFLESQRLDAGAGTLLNLGACYERLNKLASSWGAFKEAELAAANAGDSKGRAAEAARRAALLEPRLSRLAIVVSRGASVPGLRVTRDGQAVGEGQLGAPLPVDAGEHTVEASAPGRRTWTSKITIAVPGVTTAEVPLLAEAPDELQPSASYWSGQRLGGAVAGGAGVAAAIVGAALGGLAISKNDASKAGCGLDGPNACTPAASATRQSAGAFADAATGVFAASGALVVVGVVVFVTAPSRSAATTGQTWLQVAPAVGMRTTGLSLRGGW